MSGLVVVNALSASTSENKAATASCPAGKFALGGGAFISGPAGAPVAITGSYPSMVSGQPRGWVGVGTEMAVFASNWAVQAWVVCADVNP